MSALWPSLHRTRPRRRPRSRIGHFEDEDRFAEDEYEKAESHAFVPSGPPRAGGVTSDEH